MKTRLKNIAKRLANNKVALVNLDTKKSRIDKHLASNPADMQAFKAGGKNSVLSYRQRQLISLQTLRANAVPFMIKYK